MIGLFLKIQFIVLLSFFGTDSAFAGTEVGNGGVGIKVDNHLVLLDLYSFGIEQKANYPTDLPPLASYSESINKIFPSQDFPNRLIAVKLSELHKHFPLTAMSLLVAFRLYRWQFAQGPLENITHDLPPEAYANEQLFQLAIRADKMITLDRQLWKELSPENQSALIFHEGLAALVLGSQSELTPSSDHKATTKARNINSFIHKVDWAENLDRAKRFFQYFLPVNQINNSKVNLTTRPGILGLQSDFRLELNGLQWPSTENQLFRLCKADVAVEFQVFADEWLFNLASSDAFGEIDSFVLWHKYPGELPLISRKYKLSKEARSDSDQCLAELRFQSQLLLK